MRGWLLLLLLHGGIAAGQPFLDLFSASGLHSARMYERENEPATDRLSKLDASIVVPLSIGDDGDKLVLSAYYERWVIHPENDYAPDWEPSMEDGIIGYNLPITYVRVLEPDRWKLAMTAIGRWMSFTGHEMEGAQPEHIDLGDVQFGGAVLASRIVRPALTWRFGMYVNSDAFGIYGRPLLGIDWRIDPRNNLFGVLPGGMTYEHKAGRYVHWGAVYKGITSSYGERGGDFRRMDENTVGAFLDFNILPSEFVLRVEAGHSILSRYRGGEASIHFAEHGQDRYVDYGMGDGAYMKLLLAFRVRLDQEETGPPE